MICQAAPSRQRPMDSEALTNRSILLRILFLGICRFPACSFVVKMKGQDGRTYRDPSERRQFIPWRDWGEMSSCKMAGNAMWLRN